MEERKGGIVGRMIPPKAKISRRALTTVLCSTEKFAHFLDKEMLIRLTAEDPLVDYKIVIEALQSLGFYDYLQPFLGYLESYQQSLKEGDVDNFNVFCGPVQCAKEYDAGKQKARFGDFLYSVLGGSGADDWRKITWIARATMETYVDLFGLLICHTAAELAETQSRGSVTSEDVLEILASLQLEDNHDADGKAYLAWFGRF